MTEQEYICAICGEVFKKQRSDKEALQEAVEVWGKEMATDPENAIVCNDCFKLIDPAIHPEKREAAIKEYYKKDRKTP